MGAKMCSQMEKIIKIFKTEREPISHKKSLKWEPKCAPRWRKSLKIFKTEHSNNKTNFIEFCTQIFQNREFFSLKAKALRTGNCSTYMIRNTKIVNIDEKTLCCARHLWLWRQELQSALSKRHLVQLFQFLFDGTSSLSAGANPASTFEIYHQSCFFLSVGLTCTFIMIASFCSRDLRRSEKPAERQCSCL